MTLPKGLTLRTKHGLLPPEGGREREARMGGEGRGGDRRRGGEGTDRTGGEERGGEETPPNKDESGESGPRSPISSSCVPLSSAAPRVPGPDPSLFKGFFYFFFFTQKCFTAKRFSVEVENNSCAS